MKKITKLIQGMLIGVIVVASLVLIFTHFNFLGFQMFSVQSGSMEPSIRVGSIVFTIKQGQYSPGDAITFRKDDTNVTHRIVEKEVVDERVQYVVKGDANNLADPDPVNPEQIVGRVFFNIPLIGYFAGFLRTLPGLLIFIVVPSTVIIYEEIRSIKKEAKKIIKSRKNKKEGADAK